METAPDPWLANLLQCDVYRLSAARATSAAELREYLQNLKSGFYFVKLATEATDLLYELQTRGFRVVDVNVTLERRPTGEIGADAPHCQVRDFAPDRHGGVADIAGSCFAYSRFHLDPLVPNRTANRIKREWVENYICGNRGDRLWVGEADGETAGFLAQMNLQQDGASTTVIDLVGVGAEHQGKGFGRALVEKVLSTSSADRVRVGTQIANVPSLRLYEKTGFRIVQTQYVLHGHFQSERAR